MRRIGKREQFIGSTLAATLIVLGIACVADEPGRSPAEPATSRRGIRGVESQVAAPGDLPSALARELPPTAGAETSKNPSANDDRAGPPVEPPPLGIPINLATAMRLAGVNPLDIATATAQVRQGLALLLQAKVLWIPTLTGGVDYSRHDGYQQNIFSGALFQKGRQTFFVGGGPTLSVALTDAIYEPLAARRVVAAREANVQTVRNDILLYVTRAYFTLQEARGRLVGVDATIVRSRKLVDLAQGLSPGLIAPLEVNRAKAELQSLLQAREIAIQDWRVASASLAQVLLLEPEVLLEPIEPPFVEITLIPHDETVGSLVPIALNNRPEIASQRALLAAADQRLRQEKKRPFLPTMVITTPTTTTGLLAAGDLSGGPNGSLSSNGHSASFEVAAVWQLQNGGVGNIGRIRQRRAEQDLAAIDVTRTLFQVRADVSQALARVQTARARVPQTAEGLRQATFSADKNFVGLRETTRPAGELLRLVVRPQEVVAALIALNSAFEQYSAAVNQYNAAQFELYRALGQPAQWVIDKGVEPGRQSAAPGPDAAQSDPPAREKAARPR